MKNEKQQVGEKRFKSNSYEIEKHREETIHLDKAPTPHVHGRTITEDIE